VKFTFEVPYIKRLQKEGLTCASSSRPPSLLLRQSSFSILSRLLRRYQYQIWQDVEHGKQRMERGTADQPALETVIEDQHQVTRLILNLRRRPLQVAMPVASCRGSCLVVQKTNQLWRVRLAVAAVSLSQNKMYTLFIHKTEQQCKVEPLDGGSGPTLADAAQQPASPDMQALAAAGSAGSSDEGTASDAASVGTATTRKLQQWGKKPDLTYVSRNPR